jgi:hypothetical protein
MRLYHRSAEEVIPAGKKFAGWPELFWFGQYIENNKENKS